MKILFSYVILAGLILLTGCTSTDNTVKKTEPSSLSSITEGVMTTSVDNNSMPTAGVVTSFPSDIAAVYCSFKVAGIAKDDMIKATWIYIGGEAKGKENTMLNETYDIAQNPESSYYLAFYLDKPVEGWYKGNYKVVLSVNSAEKLTVPFEIK